MERLVNARDPGSRSPERPSRLPFADCGGSSCLVCLRDKCAGPVRITKITAVTHHTTAWSTACLAKSGSATTLEVSVLQTVLFIAWLSMMIKTLPRALLNSQLKTITAPMI